MVVQDESYVDCIAEGSHFDGAKLTRVTFTGCDMYWASFFMAELTDVTFERCDLRGPTSRKPRCEIVAFLAAMLGMMQLEVKQNLVIPTCLRYNL